MVPLRRIVAPLLLAALIAAGAWADNIAVTNVALGVVRIDTVEVQFDLAWDEGFSGTDDNSAAFSDAAWVFVKYFVVGTDSETSGWHHATLVSGGSLTPTADGRGVVAPIGAEHTVLWDYATDGVPLREDLDLSVCALEIVRIPTGAFAYNAGAVGGAGFNNYGDGLQIIVGDERNVPQGAPIGWANGYSAFEVAKYEVDQGQYTDFLNMIDTNSAAQRFANMNGSFGHTISNDAAQAYGSRYVASAPGRANNYMSWDDAMSYAAWCGMRPLTEMEFEKAARGGGSRTETYAWGNVAPDTETYTAEGGTHTKFHANWNNSGGQKPLATGHYLSGDVVRDNAQTGASSYGIPDLMGNLWEQVINCSHSPIQTHGDGTGSWPATWPNSSYGRGRRGAGFADTTVNYLRISDRAFAADAAASRRNDTGFRPARTSE